MGRGSMTSEYHAPASGTMTTEYHPPPAQEESGNSIYGNAPSEVSAAPPSQSYAPAPSLTSTYAGPPRGTVNLEEEDCGTYGNSPFAPENRSAAALPTMNDEDEFYTAAPLGLKL